MYAANTSACITAMRRSLPVAAATSHVRGKHVGIQLLCDADTLEQLPGPTSHVRGKDVGLQLGHALLRDADVLEQLPGARLAHAVVVFRPLEDDVARDLERGWVHPCSHGAHALRGLVRTASRAYWCFVLMSFRCEV